MKPLFIADLFCGAGGSSTGAEKAIKKLGRRMTLVCVNHWPIAIETHKRNHPTALHYVEDVQTADPYKVVLGGYLDLLMASPECRFYSRARGGRPVHDQGRMNPWAIHKWLTALDVRCLLVENVTEFTNWGPLLPDGKTDPAHKGEYFQSWFLALLKMGYTAEWKYLNAADYGDATTRVRFFLIARKDGKSIIWPEPTHSSDGATTMIGQLPRWRAAREVIEWDNNGRSLLDDAKYQRRPLAEATRRRIARGLQKFGGALAPLYIRLLGIESGDFGEGTARPFVMGKNGNSPAYRSSEQSIMTLTTAGRPVLVDPVAEPFIMANRSNNVPRSIDQPIHTITAVNMGNLYKVEPMVEPFVLHREGNESSRSTKRPLPTATTRGAGYLVQPFVLGQQSGSKARSTNKPIPTIAGAGAISLTTPLIVKYFGTGICHTVDEPLPTATTKDRVGLANPIVIPFRGERKGQKPRCHSVDEPVPAVTTEQGFGLASPFLTPYYGDHKGKKEPRAHSINQPLKTVPTANRFGLAQPVLVEVNHHGDDVRAQTLDKPLKTVTSKRGTSLVTPFMVQWDQTGGKGQYSRSIEAPVPTIVTKQNTGLVESLAIGLVEPILQRIESREVDPLRIVLINDEPYLLDIRFRMLTNLELARAMGFTDQETTYEFVGNISEVTKQIGNAVPVNMAKALVGAILE